jgi:glycosyltransferase involved in cell wall biosynthesis
VEAIDAIYTIMSPFESAELSLRLSERLGVPWIADLGDPWALDEMAVFPTGLHRRREMRRMRRLLATAGGIVMSTPQAAAELVRTFPELRDKLVAAIPNGYYAGDFQGPVPARSDDRLRIVHTGYLHTDLGLRQRRQRSLRLLLGGQIRGVEILTRSHVHILEALTKLRRLEPELAERVDLVLVGVLSAADQAVVARSPFVQMTGYVSHDESLALLRSADLLFLPMQKLPRGRRSTTVPGKTYEYAASGRPVLAAVPEGDARDILLSVGTAATCEPDDVDGMVDTLRSWLREPPKLDPNREAVEQFEYDRLAVAAAAFADEVIERARTRSIVRRRPEERISVLLIAYHFPPIGGAGAQRSVKLVRYLDRTRFEITVITGPGEKEGRWTPTDETLGREIPEDTNVIRVQGPEPPTHSGWVGRIDRWLPVSMAWSRWWRSGVLKAAAAVNADLIVASASPYESIDAAAEISRRTGTPWIAGLRDPWAFDEMVTYPTAVHRRHEIARMHRRLKTASAVVVTTDEAAKRFTIDLAANGTPPTVVSIPNGYDTADFPAIDTGPPADKLRIVHTGYFHTELGLKLQRMRRLRRLLGGQTPGVDLLGRSHVYLYAAVELLLERVPRLRDRLEIHLAGVLTDTDLQVTEASGLTTIHGYLSHADTIALMRSAGLLFLPMQKLSPSTRSTTIPGKTFEYLATGRPILGAVPEGDARDILVRAGHTVCAPDDTEAIAAAILDALRRHEEGSTSHEPRWDVIRQFERHETTLRFAEVIDDTLHRQTRRPAGESIAGPL